MASHDWDAQSSRDLAVGQLHLALLVVAAESQEVDALDISLGQLSAEMEAEVLLDHFWHPGDQVLGGLHEPDQLLQVRLAGLLLPL